MLVNVAVSDEKRAKWVINLWQTTLDSHQLSISFKGLNFAVTPSSLPKEEFVVATEKACHTIEVTEAESLRNEVLDTLRYPSALRPISQFQYSMFLSSLQKNSAIIVLPVDKGRAAVILDKTEYEQKVAAMLSDEKTYERLEKDLTPSYKRRLVPVDSKKKAKSVVSCTPMSMPLRRKFLHYTVFQRYTRKMSLLGQ